MPADTKPLIRPRNVLLAAGAVIALALGWYAYFLADMGGYLPWQEDPTPISNDVTPFAGAGFENLPTTPPKRSPTAEPTAATSPEASPAASPEGTPLASPESSPVSSPETSTEGSTLSAAETLAAIPQPTKCAVCG